MNNFPSRVLFPLYFVFVPVVSLSLSPSLSLSLSLWMNKVVYGRLIGHAKRKDFAIINYTTRDAAQTCIKETNGTDFLGQ